jgi:hypothetical protein
MKGTDDSGTEQGLPRWKESGRIEFLLRTEIAFWREQVANCGPSVPSESVERLQQALALAESRLRQLHGGDRGEDQSNSQPVRTSGDG